jgi:uncharacterized membrane protein
VPLWYDEAITLLQLSGIGSPSWGVGLVRVEEFKTLLNSTATFSNLIQGLYYGDVHPPLYYSVALVFKHVLPAHVGYVRIISLVAILLSCYFLMNMQHKKNHANSTLFILTICGVFYFSPIIQWAAINARGYSLAILLVTITLVCSVKSISPGVTKTQPSRYILFACISAGLAFWTHYFTILLTLPLISAILLNMMIEKRKIEIFSLLVLLVMISLMLPFLAQQIGARPDQMAGFSSMFNEATYLLRYVLTALFEHHRNVIIGLSQILIMTFLIATYCVDSFKTKSLKAKKVCFLMCFVCLSFFVGLLFLFFVTDKTLKGASTYRYISFLVPILAFMVAQGVLVLYQWQKKTAIFVCAFLIGNTFLSWHDMAIDLMPWKDKKNISFVLQVKDKYKASEVCFILPRGFGRGHQGKWASLLSSENKMQVISRNDDYILNTKLIAECSFIYVLSDETKQLNSAVEKFVAFLSNNKNYRLIQNNFDDTNLPAWIFVK